MQAAARPLTIFYGDFPPDYTNNDYTSASNGGYINNACTNGGPASGSLWDRFGTTPGPTHYQISHARAR